MVRLDEAAGEIVFSTRGAAKVVAKYQDVGSISTNSNTWLWSWANDSIAEQTKDLVRKVKSFGETNALEKLTTPQWGADEVDGWEMTSLTAKLLAAQGAYRAPLEHLFFFMILTEIRWAEAQ